MYIAIKALQGKPEDLNGYIVEYRVKGDSWRGVEVQRFFATKEAVAKVILSILDEAV